MRQRQIKRFVTVVLSLCILLVFAFLLAINAGFTDMSFADVVRVLFGGGSEREVLVLFDFRLVRVVLAILVGAGLGVSGGIFQTISKNELASPDFLGVNAGAGLAVLLFTLTFNGKQHILALPVVALIGASITATLVYILANQRDRPLSPLRMTLIGIAIKSGIDAMDILFTTRLSAEKFNVVNTWLIGSVYGNSWSHVIVLAPWVIGIIAFLVYRSRELNTLRLSDGTAIGLGTDLKKSRFLYLMLAVVLAAVCVAIGGAIGFVGLVSANLARRIVGPNHQYSIVVSALAGANLILISDWIARIIVAPKELILGLVVSIIGAPYFLYILLKEKK